MKILFNLGERACPLLDSCKVNCKYGRVTSLNNCEICECNDPCEHLKCKSNEECILDKETPVCRSRN